MKILKGIAGDLLTKKDLLVKTKSILKLKGQLAPTL
jgi:hypothetical protein